MKDINPAQSPALHSPTSDGTASSRLQFGAVCTVAREMGVRWLLYRLAYAIRQRVRSRPAEPQGIASDDAAVIANLDVAGCLRRFFFADARQLASAFNSGPAAVEEGERVLCGVWRYFGIRNLSVDFPPDWHRNPLTGDVAPGSCHWSEIGDRQYGDIKLIWEASRFSVVYSLARAYARTADERYPEAFWRLVEDWCAHNPPQLGPNWRCGQEAAFRIMAWCFGLHAFSASPHTTAHRVRLLLGAVAGLARRIEQDIDYARSQNNNHSISAAVGLFTVAVLFPELPRADRWREQGWALLRHEARRQIFPDGSYVQHSANYHRLMLHDYLWAFRLAQLNGVEVPGELRDCLSRGTAFLHRIADAATGRVPNYGSNDGTCILPLNDCEFDDFRPVLQAMHYFLSGQHLYPPGPWDEDLLWLFGPSAVERPQSASQPNLPALPVGAGGCHLLAGKSLRAFIRCARYENRPSQADQLHVDIWWRGLNVACDPGTYLYNGTPPWQNALAVAAAHNTVTVDSQDQMRRFGTFLWFRWAQGSVTRHVCGSDVEIWEGEHNGYRQLGVTHRRAVVRIRDSALIVVDDLLGHTSHSARLHWLLADVPFAFDSKEQSLSLDTTCGSCKVQLHWDAPGSLALVRAGQLIAGDCLGDLTTAGWYSPSYADRRPVLSLIFTAAATFPLRLVSCFSFDRARAARVDSTRVEIQEGDSIHGVRLAPVAAPAIVISDAAWASPSSGAAASVSALLIHQSFVGPSEPGGTRHFELARHLVQLGHRFTIIASDTSYLTGLSVPRMPREEHVEGVRIVRARTSKSLHRSFSWRVLAFLSFAGSSVVAALRAGAPDVVMGTTPPIFQALSAWFVAFLRRRPFLLEVRDLWPEFAIGMGVLKNRLLIAMSRSLEQFLYRRASHLLVNSPAYRDYLIVHGVSPSRITLIPNGVDSSLFHPEWDGNEIRERYGIQGKFVVTYAGAIGLANDIGTVLRAAQLLRDDDRIHFLMVGDGKERPVLEQAAHSLGLRNVAFTGGQPKQLIPAFLAASDACLAILQDIPMFSTPYPNKVFDYMAAGRPTVLAIDGVIRQVIESSGGGLYVSPGNPTALAAAVVRLADDPVLCRKMGSRARTYVVSHFDRSSHGEDFADLICQLAHSQARSS